MFIITKRYTTTETVVQEDTQQAFKDIRPQWKALAQERNITSSDIAALCLYRSLYKGEGKEGAVCRLRKAFSPVTNNIKIENGARPYGSLESALWSIKYSNFIGWCDGTLDTGAKNDLIRLSKEIRIKGNEIL